MAETTMPADWPSVDWLLGRRFSCRLTVAAVGRRPEGGAEDDREVACYLNGDRYALSLGELRQMIRSGFIVEEGP